MGLKHLRLGLGLLTASVSCESSLPPPDYSQCSLPLDPGCVSVDCAQDEAAVRFVEYVEFHIEAMGASDQLFVTDARVVPNDGISVTVVEQVEWFRFLGLALELDDAMSEVEARAEIEQRFEGYEPLPSVISQRQFRDELAACNPGLEYDPCEDHGGLGRGSIYVVDWQVFDCEGGMYRHERNRFSMDVTTGEIGWCQVDNQLPEGFDPCE